MVYLYLLAMLFFVFGIKRLTSVKSCASGNRLSEVGMAVAIVTTLIIFRDSINWTTLAAGVVVGSAIGAVLAKKTPTTQMPELVAALNGFGGISSALVAMAEVMKGVGEGSIWDGGPLSTVATIAAVLIGMLTLTGSFVAYGKLSGKSLNHPLSGAARHGFHLLLGGGAIGLGLWMATATGESTPLVAMLSPNATFSSGSLPVSILKRISCWSPSIAAIRPID